VLPAISFGEILGKGQSNSGESSVSFTLNNCKTVTKLAFIKEKQDTFSFDLRGNKRRFQTENNS
jgi:hypothetical protein